ncbi:MAG: DUF4238 domain-containing protein [Phycisphaerae bacterium]|nr:DUF4238 domain-containing protein [Phycisphaerae bacterium]
MSQPRKHHYLPQFYLRGFSVNGRQIYQIEKDSSRGYLCSIEDAAAIRDYYELDYPGAKDPQSVEKRLAEIENRHSDVLRQIIENGSISPDVHARLVEFVSLMRLRVPAVKAYIEKFLRQMVRSTTVIMERNGMLPPAPEVLPEVLKVDEVQIVIANWKCLEEMFVLAANPKILKILASMQPRIFHVPAGAMLLTCDQPVAIYHPEASPNDPYGIGIVHAHTEISFPLSSQVLLHLCWDTSVSENRLLTSAEVDEFNRRTIIMADSLIFAPEQSEYATAAVKRYRQYSAGVDLQVLDDGTGHFHIQRFRPVMSAERYGPFV